MLANKKLLWMGLYGIAITAVSWLTPLFVVVLNTIGLSVSRAWIDTVMALALAIFIGLTKRSCVWAGSKSLTVAAAEYRFPKNCEFRLPARKVSD